MDNLIGKSLGRYHILEQLGEGGMATVYKAYDTRLERDVAVKIIRWDAFPPNQLENTLKRFEREAKALARLSHPNIVKILDYGEYENAPYLVEEYLPGGTLKQHLGKPLPWQEAFHLLMPVAQALDYAHEQKIVHRDIKPSNILLTAKGQPMLTDFGIAKLLAGDETQNLTGTGVGIGTPEYMAPEQWTGELGLGLDIYSLGVVLYELVTGRKPYTADTPAAILLKQVNDPLPRPSEFVPDLPEGVEKVLLKAMAKKPEDRYQDMSKFVQAMEEQIGEWADRSNKPATDETRTIRVGQKEARTQLAGTGATTPLEPAKQPLPEVYGEQAPAAHRQRSANKKYAVILAVIAAIALIGFLTSRFVRKPVMLVPSARTLTRVPIFTPFPVTTPALGIGSTWTRPADHSSMVFVPAGNFTMGSPGGFGNDDEHPEHTVYLSAFWIDKTLVTNGMYSLCVQAGGCVPPQNQSSASTNVYYGNPQYNDFPVIYMDWLGANTYCHWAGARLPTEAEWEKAARGTDARVYPWGNASPTCSLANYKGCVGDTSAVGIHTLGASPYGALDMAGNVLEWTEDWYDPGYYVSSPSQNPQGPASGGTKSVRGGIWSSSDSILRSATRAGYIPTNASLYVGFRCSRSQ